MGVVNDQTLDAILHKQLKEQVFAFTPAPPRSHPQSGQEKVPQSRFTRIVFGSGYGQHGISPSTNRAHRSCCFIAQITNSHRFARTRLCHNDMPSASMPCPAQQPLKTALKGSFDKAIEEGESRPCHGEDSLSR